MLTRRGGCFIDIYSGDKTLTIEGRDKHISDPSTKYIGIPNMREIHPP